MTQHATTLLERLGLPYRVKLLAAGDTGLPARRRTTSRRTRPASARGSRYRRAARSPTSRLDARTSAIGPAPGEKPRFVHTLNASGLAFPARSSRRSSSTTSSRTAASRCPRCCGRISAPTRSAEPCAAARRSSSSPLESCCSSDRTSSTHSASSSSSAARRSAPGACMPGCTRRCADPASDATARAVRALAPDRANRRFRCCVTDAGGNLAAAVNTPFDKLAAAGGQRATRDSPATSASDATLPRSIARTRRSSRRASARVHIGDTPLVHGLRIIPLVQAGTLALLLLAGCLRISHA